MLSGEDFDKLMLSLPVNERSRVMLDILKKTYEATLFLTQGLTKPLNENTIIPKLMHFIWLGPREYPDYALEVLNEWIDLNPGYDVYLWIDHQNNEIAPHDVIQVKKVGADFKLKFLQKEYDAHETYAGKSDILRLELLYEFGGIYTDYDNRCCRNLDVLTHSASFFGVYEYEDKLLLIQDPVSQDLIEPRLSNCILGSVPKHPIFEIVFRRMKDTHAFFLKKGPKIQLYQLIISTYIHLTLGIAEYLIQNPSNRDLLILPFQLAWSMRRGIQVFDHPDRFFEIQYLDSVGWNAENYDIISFKNILKDNAFF